MTVPPEKIIVGRRTVTVGLFSAAIMATAGPGIAQPAPTTNQRARTRTRPTISQASSPTFKNPPDFIDAGNLNYSLNFQKRTTNIGGASVSALTYTDGNNPQDSGLYNAPLNRPPVGPTLTLDFTKSKILPVTIKVNNNLPQQYSNMNPVGHGPGHTMETPHGFNITNLHTHGLHVAPIQDNVYVELAPYPIIVANQARHAGHQAKSAAVEAYGTYNYSYTFGQTAQGTTKLPAGTYWYHPHKHGSVGYQVASGLAGAIVVKGDLDLIPNVAGRTEQIMVAQLIQYAAANNEIIPEAFYGLNNQTQANPNAQMTINGQVTPTLTMAAGEIQRWRFINATYDQFFYLSFSDQTRPPSDAPVLYAIATDGVPLTNSASGITVPFRLSGAPIQTPTSDSSPPSFADVVMNEIAVIAPAQRLDLLVQMPASARGGAEYTLWAITYPSTGPNSSGPSQPIAHVKVNGEKRVIDELPANSAFDADALYRPPITLPTTQNPTQELAFTFGTGAQSNLSLINGVPFDEAKPQVNLKLNMSMYGK